MASAISWRDQYVTVANRRLTTLTEFALQIGTEYAQSEVEREYVRRLDHWCKHEVWPGIDFDIDEHFPTIAEKKFWSRCFYDLARRIFRREIGDNSNTVWQAGTIGDASIVARMVTRAVQEEENAWYPKTEDGKEFAEVLGKIKTAF